MKETIAELDKELQEIDDQWMKLVERLPDEDRQAFLAQRQEFREKQAKRRQEFDDLVKKCHPTDDHWPPHPECPLCQRVFQKIENEARAALGEEAAKDEATLEKKVIELFEKRYLKGPSDAGNKG